MQDTEFTVEEGRLYMLQTRNAKRPAQAAVRFAVDAVNEGLLTREEALATIDPGSLDALLHPTFDPEADFDGPGPRRQRLPGRRQGRDRVHRRRRRGRRAGGRDVILVRPFTDAEDVAGFHAAKGILTSEGGKASHAALVARGMGRPAVVGADALEIDLAAKTVTVDGTELHEGDPIAHRRHQGLRDRPTTCRWWRPQVDDNFQHVLAWADELRAWACAPTPTRPRTRGGPASSAPRASGCAGPSTCSWPRTASPRCGR